MDKRRTKRTKRRLTCELQIGSDRYRGIIRDVSESGLFIQTTASAQPGTVIDVRIGASRDLPEMGLRAVVARARRAPARLARVVAGGLGVQILDAPEIYYRVLLRREPAVSGAQPAVPVARPGAPAREPKSGASEVAGRPFRVRVTQSESARSRRLDVIAASEEAARKEALARVGEGWEVLEVTPG